jgi:hypothetical protein
MRSERMVVFNKNGDHRGSAGSCFLSKKEKKRKATGVKEEVKPYRKKGRTKKLPLLNPSHFQVQYR